MRLKKYDILNSKYPSDEKGATELMKNLSGSGLLNMDLTKYDSEVISRRSVLYSENKRPKYLYYVRKGKIKAYKQNEDGKEYITHLYAEGDYIGYLALLENKPYDDTAEVLEEADIVLIPKDDFLKAIFNDLTIAGKFIKLITQNVKAQEERLLSLAYSSLRKRIAKALLDINAKF